MSTAFIDFSHGLGDAVQVTCLLQHLRKHRPDWLITVRARHGTHSALHGLCFQVLSNKDSEPREVDFDKVFRLPWYENHNGYRDCPNTKVTNCLREIFHIEPEPALLRYSVQVRPAIRELMRGYLASCGCTPGADGKYNAVVIHYEGNTSSDRKNLDHGLIRNLCSRFIDLGFVPVILDWDHRSPVPDQRRIFCPVPGDGDIWEASGTGDAERITGLIAESSLMLGIDSGPQKCAGATDTPTLAVWTRQDPMRFYDLCPNVLHIIRDDFRDYDCLRKPECLAYFQANYRFVTYAPDKLFGVINERASAILRKQPAVPAERRQPFCVGIPTLSRYELLEHCIASLNAGSVVPERIYVIDNGGQYDNFTAPNVHVVKPMRNLGVAASWNLLYQLTADLPLILCNDDLRVSSDVLERLLAHPADCALANRHSCFRLKREVYNEIGPFDEKFWPAYYEDQDYTIRMRLKGKTVATVEHSGISHARSSTIEAMQGKERADFNDAWDECRAYFIKKWGGLPDHETFIEPFGGMVTDWFTSQAPL